MKRVFSLYKASYTGLNPASWWLSFVMFINRSGTMVVPFMTLYLTQSRGYSISQAGIVMGLFGAGAICGGLIGGRLSDRFGFYTVQMLALICGGLMFFVLGQMRSFYPICSITFLLAVINDSFRPANALAIAHYSKKENRTRSYSLNRLAINLGWAFGGSLGGFIAAHNYNLLFIVDGCTNIGAAIILRIFLSPTRQTKALVKPVQPKVSPYEVYRDTRYMIFIALVCLYAYVFFQLFSTIPVYFRQSLHLSETVIGATMAGNGIIIAMFEMVLVFGLEGRRQPLQFIPVGTVLVALSFLVFNILTTSALVIVTISTIIVTVGEMLSMPFMNTYWIGRSTDANRGQYAGMYTVAWATAQVLGPATGSRMADKLGFTALWWLMTGLAIVSAIGFWLLHQSHARKLAQA